MDQHEYLSMGNADRARYDAQIAAIQIRPTIEPIDDYIEPLLEIKRMSIELHTLTLKKDFEATFQVCEALESETLRLKNWCWKNIGKE